MTRWWRAAPIRVRLTVWYTSALSLMLVLYATVTYVAVRHEFHEQMEEYLSAGPGTGGRATADEAAHLDRQLREVLLVLAAGLPIVVSIAGFGGYVLTRRTLAPIDHLAADARRITAVRLHERLTVANEHDEVGRLAAVVNETFARLESSFEQLRRFTADASHELRTPLSVLRATGENCLGEPRTAAEYKDAIGSMLEEVDRLTRLVDTLLRLSRGDTGAVALHRERVDLGSLAADVAASLGVLAEERRQRLTVAADADVCATVDRLVLREAVSNLLDNALKYSPHGSAVSVRVQRVDGRAVVAVADEGPGIPAEHRDRVFDRFYRVDEGRSRERGGAGLGLAIARWAVEANGGTISLASPGRGSEFRITLPSAP